MSLTKVSYSMISGAPLSVLDFGADPTGTSDSSAAFNSAISALPSSGGSIYIPAGTYNLNIVITNPNVHLIGAGSGSTYLFNNTSVPGTFCIDFQLPALSSSVKPYGAWLSGVTITGNLTNNYHAIRVVNALAGEIRDIYVNNVGYALAINNCYTMIFSDFFVTNFACGIITQSNSSNDNHFDSWYFFQGNSALSAQPINDTLGLLGQNTFIDMTMDGALMQSYSILNGSGNTFITPRFESCTPATYSCYIQVNGNDNHFLNPLVTTETNLTTGFYFYVTGTGNKVDKFQSSGCPTQLIFLSEASSYNEIQISTTGVENQALIGALFNDLGSNNSIDLDGEDFMFNNTITSSNIAVTNIFPNSTNMSSITNDGLTQALLTGSAGRLGPFSEGLIQTFTGVTGNRQFYIDVLPTRGGVGSAISSLFVYSFWAKSLTSGGETITVFSGRTVGQNTATVAITSDKYTRVVIPFNTDGTTYNNLYVGVQLISTSSGIDIYGSQVVECGARGALFPAFYAGGYVPTSSQSSTSWDPNYSRNRKHLISPANAVGSLGDYIQNLVPASGQPTGWYCTAAGSPATWTAGANL
jgi:hypothetical protein